MIHWEDFRFLLAAHRGGSLAAAARALGVDATTVGRRLAAAERALGARIFTRTPDGLRATSAGLAALAAAASMEHAVQAAERTVAGSDGRVEGSVRVTSGEGVLTALLAPALPALRARHPNLSVELVAATRALDLLRGEAELAVRLFRPHEPGLVARRLGTLRYGLYASRAYLDAAGFPRSSAELAEHAVLGFDATLESTPEMRWLGRHVAPVRWAVRTSSTAVLLAACRAGVGIAPLAARFAASTPELLPVLPEAELPAREAWLVVHPELRRSARIQATSAWIADALRGPGTERREDAPARRRSGQRKYRPSPSVNTARP